MKVNSSVKTEISILEMQKKYDEVIKRLQKIKMSNPEYDCLDTEIFVNHTMAKSYYKKGNKDFANHYLKCNKEILENQQPFEDRRFEYYNYLWLYSDVNKDGITKEEYCKNFVEIYRYYNEIDSSNFSDKAIKNIIFAEDKKKEKIINFLKSVIDEYGREDKTTQNMVEDCKKFDNQIYIMLKNYLYDDNEIAI